MASDKKMAERCGCVDEEELVKKIRQGFCTNLLLGCKINCKSTGVHVC